MITVYNLSNDSEYCYHGITEKDALVNTYLMESGNLLGIHDPKTRKKVESLIITGTVSLAIGDLSVLKRSV